ncbi:MAG: hypothetical protein KOO61_05575 [Spirochaetales bacterium]|nr:hypothetical protein [Spirochaetales bacterium]
MIEIRPGMHGDELPTLTDVTQEEIDFYLDPEAKDVPELRPDPGAAERERLGADGTGGKVGRPMGVGPMQKRETRPMLAVMLMVLLIGSMLHGCASPRDIRKEFEPYGLSLSGEYRIYVATEDTPWKQEIVTLLSIELGKDYGLTVENLQTLNQIEIDDWDLVIVLSTFYAFGLQSDTAVFLDALEDKDKVILLVTSAISDLEDYGVDAVTAASVGNTREDAKSLTSRKEPSEIAHQLAKLVFARTEE